ncbi:MAG: AMP-binding protein [Acidimicrobiia bacterium]|nr:AMP-binding protein [Acidimicrobiia bacterium]
MTTSEWKLRTVAPDLARRYVSEGFWDDDTLGQLLGRGLHDGAALRFTVRSHVRPWRGTLGAVDDLARRVAAGLRVRGVGPGDVVAFQLPNWVEAAASFYAAAYLGAVVVPIVHFYGPKEVGYILRRTGVRVLVTAERFGHVDFLANLEELRPSLPDLELVAVVGEAPAGTIPFASLAHGAPLDGPLGSDPEAPALVAYTSGTTSDPKGVVHSHRTIGAEIRQLGAAQPEGPPRLTGAPVGHGIGMLAALLLPVWRGEEVHLIDVWNPAEVLAAMLEDGVASGTGATFFLTSLLDHPDLTPAHLELMHHVGLGGSAVPAAVADRATALGLSVVRMFGSTEHPSITGCTHDDPLEKRLYTDGRPLPGVEMRLLDEDGREVAPDEPGEIVSRGPDCFVGYTDPALTDEAFDADGWYATGDVGVLDTDGYLAITDRKKDIIIRGGENISALEVEEQLLRMPGVAEVAVVAAPDERLGEHACAFVRMVPAAPTLTLDAVRDRLGEVGLARQKWPEELRSVEDFPRTPSGKIQKFVLRRALRDESGA